MATLWSFYIVESPITLIKVNVVIKTLTWGLINWKQRIDFMTKMNHLANFQFAPKQMRKAIKVHMSFVMCAHHIALFSSMQVWQRWTYVEDWWDPNQKWHFFVQSNIVKSTSTLTMCLSKTCKVRNVCLHPQHKMFFELVYNVELSQKIYKHPQDHIYHNHAIGHFLLVRSGYNLILDNLLLMSTTSHDVPFGEVISTRPCDDLPPSGWEPSQNWKKFIASKGELLGDTTNTRILFPQNVIAKSITQVLSVKVGGGLLHTFQCTGPMVALQPNWD